MLKPLKHVTIVIAILMLVVTLISVTQAQRPTFPPLPDLNRVLSPPGATPTAKPNEKRPDDVIKPMVTAIPYSKIIDKAGKEVPMAEKAAYTIHKKNGDYVRILVGPKQLEAAREQDIRSILGLSEGDEIVNFTPPLSLMGQHPPRPGQLGENNLVTPTPIVYREVIDRTGSRVPIADKATFIVRKKNGDYIKVLVTIEEIIEAKDSRDPGLILMLLGQSEEDTIVDVIPPVNFDKWTEYPAFSTIGGK